MATVLTEIVIRAPAYLRVDFPFAHVKCRCITTSQVSALQTVESGDGEHTCDFTSIVPARERSTSRTGRRYLPVLKRIVSVAIRNKHTVWYSPHSALDSIRARVLIPLK